MADEELAVPNTSLAFSPVPNNSIAAGEGARGMPGYQMSEDMLSDIMTKEALYALFNAPPSKQGGDTSAASATFEHIDFQGRGKIPWRHVQQLLVATDQESYGKRFEPTYEITVEEFIAFVEDAAKDRASA